MSGRFVRVGVASVALGVAAVVLSAARELSAREDAPERLRTTPPPIDTMIFKGLRWRSVGPERGGRSIAISGVKGQPKLGYFGATGGGLWKT
ncbi:MAG TPA: hypothetical protein VGM50_19650, partial [Gemmatimonadaceae bacterium]